MKNIIRKFTSQEKTLREADLQLFNLLQKEKTRIQESITLNPCENLNSNSVYQALSSPFQNKYSEVT